MGDHQGGPDLAVDDRNACRTFAVAVLTIIALIGVGISIWTIESGKKVSEALRREITVLESRIEELEEQQRDTMTLVKAQGMVLKTMREW